MIVELSSDPGVIAQLIASPRVKPALGLFSIDAVGSTHLHSGVARPLATSQDGSVHPRYAATGRGVMQVGLIKVLREPASSISPCRRTKSCTFIEQAGLALCCEPRKVVRDMPVGLLVVSPLRERTEMATR